MSVTVSVVVTCFNLGEYLDECLNSVLRSSFQDFEIVLIDDGSTKQSTLDVLASIHHPKIKLFRTANRGLFAARNTGIQEARGRFCLPLDADDLVAENYLEKAVRHLEDHPDVAFVTPWFRLFGEEKRVVEVPHVDSLATILHDNCLCVASVVRMSVLREVGGYAPDLHGFEDWNLWIALISGGYKQWVLEEVGFLYRVRRGSMVKQCGERRPELVRKIVMNHLSLYQENVAEVVYLKEVEIQRLKQQVRDFERSNSYRLGRFLTRPYRRLREAWRALRHTKVVP